MIKQLVGTVKEFDLNISPKYPGDITFSLRFNASGKAGLKLYNFIVKFRQALIKACKDVKDKND